MIIVRNKETYGGPGFYIGRPSILGNPFSCKEKSLARFKVGSDEEAVARYWEYMIIRYCANDEFKDAIDEILVHARINPETNIICWCSPNVCHGDCIKDFVEDLIRLDERDHESDQR
jgi:hypothetical protein